MRYFGERWGGPMLEDAESMDTPVGLLCMHCEEKIVEGDRGCSYDSGLLIHYECALRMVIGGANHIIGTCTCCGGDQDPDPPGLSPREAAKLAVRLFEQRQAGSVN